MEGKQITVDGKPLLLSNQQEYNGYINRKGVECLEDTNGIEIGGFASLVPGGTYRKGPPIQAAIAPVSLNFYLCICIRF